MVKLSKYSLLIALSAILILIFSYILNEIYTNKRSFSLNRDIVNLINRSLMSEWKPENEKFLSSVNNKFCNNISKQKWYIQDINKCQLVWPWDGREYCGMIRYTRSCAVVIIPRDYYEDKFFMNELLAITMSPCNYLMEIKRKNYLEKDPYALAMFDLFRCDIGINHREYKIYIFIVEKSLDEINDILKPPFDLEKIKSIRIWKKTEI